MSIYTVGIDSTTGQSKIGNTGNDYVSTESLGTGVADNSTYLRGDNSWNSPASGSLPAGVIVMWSGLLINIPAGWNLCDGTNGTPDLRERFIKGWTDAVDPGGTGGSNTHTHDNHADLVHAGSAVADHVYTPEGDISQPTFTGDALGVHAHAAGTYANTAASAGTPAGSVSQPTFTGDALATHSHTSGTLVPSAHAGSAVTDHSAHTHSVTSNVTVADHSSHTHTYTEVPNHVHVQNLPTSQSGGQSSGTRDASTTGSSADALSTANPTGGVATGTTAGPSATLTHSPTNNAVTSGNPSATLTHSVTQPNTHTMSGSTAAITAGTPAGAVSTPTFTGDALGTHNHAFGGSSESVSSGTPTGSVSTPIFTGTEETLVHGVTQADDHVISSHSASDNQPEYLILAFIMKM
jgi:hypothetical protein